MNILEKFYSEIENAKKSNLVTISIKDVHGLSINYCKKQIINLTFKPIVKIPTVCRIFDHLLHHYGPHNFEIKMKTTHKIAVEIVCPKN